MKLCKEVLIKYWRGPNQILQKGVRAISHKLSFVFKQENHAAIPHPPLCIGGEGGLIIQGKAICGNNSTCLNGIHSYIKMFIFMISRSSLNLGHMGSETRSMIEKACTHSHTHSHFYAKTLIAVALHFTNAFFLIKHSVITFSLLHCLKNMKFD